MRQDLKVRVQVSVPIPKVPYIDYKSGYVYGFMGLWVITSVETDFFRGMGPGPRQWAN